MDLSGQEAFAGIKAKATPQKDNSANDVKVGKDSTVTSLSSATKIVSFDAILNGASTDLVIDLSDLDSTGTTAWTAGTAQVETGTVVGTVTTAGNAEVIVTAADVTGSPVTLSVAVANTDTASQVATKIRTDIAANTAISTYYTVSGAGADVVLTHKGTVQYTIQGTSTPVYPANDATLNISIDNDTCAGLTTAATSTNTTAGVASAGCYVPGLDANDFEGLATGGASSIYGLYIGNATATGGDGVTVTQSTTMVDQLIPAQGILQTQDPAGGIATGDITIEPENSGPCLVEVVIACV